MDSKASKTLVKKVAGFSESRGDHGISMFPGLFTSKTKGAIGESTSLKYRSGSEQLSVTMFECLGAVDVRVLHGLAAIACAHGHSIDVHADTESERGLELLDSLSPDRTLEDTDAIVTSKFFLYELARVMGLSDSSSSIETIKKSLARLYHVTLFWSEVEDGRIVGAPRRSFIISKFNVSKKLGSGRYEIGLNSRISRAITGAKGDRFLLVDMHEVRAIRGDATLLMHSRLCGFINEGTTHVVKIGTLMGYAWYDCDYESQAGAALYRQHKLRARKAIAELRSIGWTITEQEDNKFLVFRPKQDHSLEAVTETTVLCDGNDGIL